VEFSCFLMTGMDTPDQIALAEQLGYTLATVSDSPGKCADPWIVLACAAQRTSTIRLGVMVTTPKLRNVVTTATTVATLHALAPGRVEVGVGPGSRQS
jgi:5,10-methylenetetrahydromethanopterin reductase